VKACDSHFIQKSTKVVLFFHKVESEFTYRTSKSLEHLASNWNKFEENLFQYAKTKLGNGKSVAAKDLIKQAEVALTQYGMYLFLTIRLLKKLGVDVNFHFSLFDRPLHFHVYSDSAVIASSAKHIAKFQEKWHKNRNVNGSFHSEV
jgi:hypothetical protein